ncbi:unnamed protein product [Linum trigynum]|uniref:RNase H type-1 domain-containing protein n=1 Tax=Linum trigynum TaxID=586398 RepID=A0AAV2FL54_9ROSI
MKLATTNHFHPMLMESDCQPLIKKLDRPEAMSLGIQSICEEIRDWAKRSGGIDWRCWGRNEKGRAHGMVKMRCRWEETKV